MECPLFCSQIHPFNDEVAAQMDDNRVEKQKAAKKTKDPGGIGAATVVVVTMVRPWWPLAGLVPISRSTAFWCIFLASGSCHGLPVLGLFRVFLQAS